VGNGDERARGVLDGVRVVDASTGVAGPCAAMLLADFGAEVVRAEPPGGEDGRTGRAVWDRGKRSVVADDQTLARMLRGADVLVTSTTPAHEHGEHPALVELVAAPYATDGRCTDERSERGAAPSEIEVDGAGPALGSRFRGRNQLEGMGEWETISTVVECEPPRSFAWAVVDPDNPAATWRFDLVPEGDGTLLRQHVLMGPGPSGLTDAIAERPEAEERLVEWRREDHRTKMTATLEGIKAAVEG
jgi:hypothetical protein